MLRNQEKSDISLSKTLSWLLRHAANEQGLQISSEGYISVADILTHSKLKAYSLKDIRRVVETSDKQRFSLRETRGLLEIRANQGHSLGNAQDLQLEEITSTSQVENVIHGTYFPHLKLIKRNGLCRMHRNHIHFASGLPHNHQVISGARQSAEVFIYVDLAKALADGLRFFRSANGVILTPGNDKGVLAPDYFDKISSGYPHKCRAKYVEDYFTSFGVLDSFRYNRNTNTYHFMYQDPSVAQRVVSEPHFCNGFPVQLTCRPPEIPISPDAQLGLITPSNVIESIKTVRQFDNQVKTLQQVLQQRSAQIEEFSRIIRTDLEESLCRFRDCKVHFFGSIVTQLDWLWSDLDVYMENVLLVKNAELDVLKLVRKELLRGRKFSDLLLIGQAKVPIIKCIHTSTGMCVDLNIKNMLSVYNSRLIRYYLSLDPKLQPLMLMIKFWWETAGLKKQNFFSSYALCMMFIFYLQQEPYNLPSVYDLQKDTPDASQSLIEGCNCFWNENAEVSSDALKNSTNKTIFKGFLEFYLNFDYMSLVICPYLGRPIPKFDFLIANRLPNAFAKYKGSRNSIFDAKKTFCVQDPFELTRNVTASIELPILHKLAASLERVSRTLDGTQVDLLYKVLKKSNPLSASFVLKFDGKLANYDGWQERFEKHTIKFLTKVMKCQFHKRTASKNSRNITLMVQEKYDIYTKRIDFLTNCRTKLPDVDEFDLEIAASTDMTSSTKPTFSQSRFNVILCFSNLWNGVSITISGLKKGRAPTVFLFLRIKLAKLFILREGDSGLNNGEIIAPSEDVNVNGRDIEKVEDPKKSIDQSFEPDRNRKVFEEDNTVDRTDKLQGEIPAGLMPEMSSVGSNDMFAAQFLYDSDVEMTSFREDRQPPATDLNDVPIEKGVAMVSSHIKNETKSGSSKSGENPTKTRGQEHSGTGGGDGEKENGEDFDNDDEEDIPADFFDDFANEDFMEGLDIVDAWDGDPGKRTADDPDDVLDANCSSLRSSIGSRSKSSDDKRSSRMKPATSPRSKDKRRKSPIRWRKGSPPRDLRFRVAEKRSFDAPSSAAVIRRDPEKTKRDINRDKMKCAKDKEQKFVTDKLKLVETGLVPPGMELEADLPSRNVTTIKSNKRSAEKMRESKKSPSSRDSKDPERKIRGRLSGGRGEEKRNNHGILFATASRSPPPYRSRPKEKEYVRIRRRSSSITLINSSDRDWIRNKRRSSRKRSRSKEEELRKVIRKYEQKEASKKKSFLEEIAEKLNEVRPKAVTPHYNQIRPTNFQIPAPAPVPAPTYFPQTSPVHNMVQQPQYDQSFFIGDAYMTQKPPMVYGMIPPAGYPQTQYPHPQAMPAVQNAQYPYPRMSQLSIPTNNVQPTQKPSPKAVTATATTVSNENKVDPADVDKLFADKKISLSDFLTITAKPEVHSSTPEHLKKKIKVIARCQDAIKALSNERRITGRLHVKHNQEDPVKVDTKYQSPLRRIPIVRFSFTTPSKMVEEVDTFGVAIEKILQKLGILKADDVIDLDSPSKPMTTTTKSVFSDEGTLALTLKASQLSGKSPVKILPQSPAPCEECKKRNSKVFTEVSTQCEDTTKEMISISTQVTEDDLKPRTDSIASMTPAQLLGRDKEASSKETESKMDHKIASPDKKNPILIAPVEEQAFQQKQQSYPVKAEAHPAIKNVPPSKPPGRGRGPRYEPYNQGNPRGCGYGRSRGRGRGEGGRGRGEGGGRGRGRGGAPSHARQYEEYDYEEQWNRYGDCREDGYFYTDTYGPRY